MPRFICKTLLQSVLTEKMTAWVKGEIKDLSLTVLEVRNVFKIQSNIQVGESSMLGRVLNIPLDVTTTKGPVEKSEESTECGNCARES